MKRYVILAGVNGAGKSTLFSLISSLSEIEKINLDEMVREIGDWRDMHAVVEAGKLVIHRINNYFIEGVSFSQETTLCGKSRMLSLTVQYALFYRYLQKYRLQE